VRRDDDLAVLVERERGQKLGDQFDAPRMDAVLRLLERKEGAGPRIHGDGAEGQDP